MISDSVRAIADAVLYEGYILWPYRRSALKNQRRFTFGGVYPPAHTALHPDDPCAMRTEVLLQPDAGARVAITVRFLQVVERIVMRKRGSRLEPASELSVGGQRYESWEEAVEHEIVMELRPLDELEAGQSAAIAIEADSTDEPLRDDSGKQIGALVRRWRQLRGEIRCGAVRVDDSTWKVWVQIANSVAFTGHDRQEALRQTFCSTHTLLHATGARFMSLADPPPELAGAAAACDNRGTWPVPVGEPNDMSTILSSPIILEDHPRVAPESPGDMFDGGEIDQLLILNILSLTDEEKAEMAAADPRAKEILRRTEALTPDQLMALHGTVRELRLVR